MLMCREWGYEGCGWTTRGKSTKVRNEGTVVHREVGHLPRVVAFPFPRCPESLVTQTEPR